MRAHRASKESLARSNGRVASARWDFGAHGGRAGARGVWCLVSGVWTACDPALWLHLTNAQKVTQVTSVAHSKRRDWRRAQTLRTARPGNGREGRMRSAHGSSGLARLRGSLAEAGVGRGETKQLPRGFAWSVAWCGVVETLEGGPAKARQGQSKQAQDWLLWGGRIHYGSGSVSSSPAHTHPPKISRPRMVSGISNQCHELN